MRKILLSPFPFRINDPIYLSFAREIFVDKFFKNYKFHTIQTELNIIKRKREELRIIFAHTPVTKSFHVQFPIIPVNNTSPFPLIRRLKSGEGGAATKSDKGRQKAR